MRWRLSAAQWDVLTEVLLPHNPGLESYPAPIQVSAHGRTDAERSRIRSQVAAELSRLGLLRGGRVEPDLEAGLNLLHRPEVWVSSLWLPEVSAEQPVRLVAARRGTAAVCAWQQPERPGATLLEVIRADGLAAAVVRRLPAHPAGTSPGVSLALASEAGPDRPGLLATVPAARTTAERSTAAVAAILDRPHLRAGQIVAQLRDPAGRVCRSRILRWCDNPDGRYQVTVDRPSGGPQRLTVISSDARRLGEGVQRLLDSLSTR